ncbi:MAG TPA: hypothetical protein VFD03_10560 [Clostridia bacterium]|nr:hypothetical protein [Clostridia bacterium]
MYKSVVKNQRIIIVAGILLLSALTAYATTQQGHVSISREITYQDPNDKANYLVLNTFDHTFILHQNKDKLDVFEKSNALLSGKYEEITDLDKTGNIIDLYKMTCNDNILNTVLYSQIVTDGIKQYPDGGNVWVRK